MKNFLIALRMLFFMSLVTGLIYPLIVTGLAQGFFSKQANGSLIEKSGVLIGSDLLAQKFVSPKYFWSRPSTVDFNPLPSGGSNQGPISGALKKTFAERKSQLQTAHPQGEIEPPQDLLFASASGLDPDISPEAAQYQVQRVALARGMNLELVAKIVKDYTKSPTFGILGEPTVNVFILNRALDEKQGIQK